MFSIRPRNKSNTRRARACHFLHATIDRWHRSLSAVTTDD
jgi:hypothetical protein